MFAEQGYQNGLENHILYNPIVYDCILFPLMRFDTFFGVLPLREYNLSVWPYVMFRACDALNFLLRNISLFPGLHASLLANTTPKILCAMFTYTPFDKGVSTHDGLYTHPTQVELEHAFL